MINAKKYRISYAQNREDIIVATFFPDIKKGFYLDVGANHPQDDSVTKIFYDQGWSGINIEPNKELYSALVRERTRDTNLNIGISDQKGTLLLREYSNHGLSTFSKEIKDGYRRNTTSKTESYIDVKVPVETLDYIVKKYAPSKHINFMKVDVEGFEYQVLKGNDWENIRPELICIESNHIVHDWRSILENADYALVFNDGLNDYYLSKESEFRLKKFDYAEALILGPQIVSPGIFSILNSSENLENKVEGLEKINQDLQLEANSLLESRNNLLLQLEGYKGLKAQTRSLVIEVYSRINKKIDDIGTVKKPHKTLVFPAATNKDIIDSIKNYDRRAFSEKRIIGGKLQRLIATVLKKMLKLVVNVLRRLMSLFRKITRGIK